MRPRVEDDGSVRRGDVLERHPDPRHEVGRRAVEEHAVLVGSLLGAILKIESLERERLATVEPPEKGDDAIEQRELAHRRGNAPGALHPDPRARSVVDRGVVEAAGLGDDAIDQVERDVVFEDQVAVLAIVGREPALLVAVTALLEMIGEERRQEPRPVGLGSALRRRRRGHQRRSLRR